MLHRTKYNRFRNESVASVDELLHGLPMNAKVPASPETPYTPPAELQPPASAAAASGTPASLGSNHLEDGGTTLCTLINKVSGLKFSNSGSLLGIKGLPSAVKDLAVSRLQVGGGAGSCGSGGPSPSAAAAAAAATAAACGAGASACGSHPAPGPPQLEPAVGMSKKSRADEVPLGRVEWNPGGGGALVSKPPRGWLHSSDKISGPGVTYVVKVGASAWSPPPLPFVSPHSCFSFNDWSSVRVEAEMELQQLITTCP